MAYDPNAGPGPASAGGGLPPDLLALLGGGGSPDQGGAPAPDQSAGGGPDAQKAVEILKQMMDLGRQYLDVEPDEEDKATMTDVMARLQKYLAKDQAEADGMLQGKLSPRALRKAGSGPAAA